MCSNRVISSQNAFIVCFLAIRNWRYGCWVSYILCGTIYESYKQILKMYKSFGFSSIINKFGLYIYSVFRITTHLVIHRYFSLIVIRILSTFLVAFKALSKRSRFALSWGLLSLSILAYGCIFHVIGLALC